MHQRPGEQARREEPDHRRLTEQRPNVLAGCVATGRIADGRELQRQPRAHEDEPGPRPPGHSPAPFLSVFAAPPTTCFSPKPPRKVKSAVAASGCPMIE